MISINITLTDQNFLYGKVVFRHIPKKQKEEMLVFRERNETSK